VHRLTGGSPLFVKAVVEATPSEESPFAPGADPEPGSLRIPQAIRDSVRRRVSRLSSAASELLSTAAAIGCEFSVDTLACVLVESRVPFQEMLREAEGRDLVAKIAPDRYHFRSAFVREVLLQEMSPGRHLEIRHVLEAETAVAVPADSSLRERQVPSALSGRNVFLRAGDHWTVAHLGKTFHLKDSIGLRYIAYLLRHERRHVSCFDLIVFAEGIQPDAISPLPTGYSKHDLKGLGLQVRKGFEDAGEVIDTKAEDEYRRRWEEIDVELAAAQVANDRGRVEALSAERDFLLRELLAGLGMRGRHRRAASVAERARLNVTRAIRSAIGRIATYDDALGDHLETSIRTGTACCYDPAPGEEKAWAF
jgi:hypothetical protein